MKSTYLRNKINEFKDEESSKLSKKIMTITSLNNYVDAARAELFKERDFREGLTHTIYGFLEEVID